MNTVDSLLTHTSNLQDRHPGCLPFDRKIRLGCQKHNGKQFTSWPQNCHIRYGLNPKKGRICVVWVWNREGTEKLVSGEQHSNWFVPTGINRLPQNIHCTPQFLVGISERWPFIRNFWNFLSNGVSPCLSLLPLFDPL